jgi:hypothetical protein
MSNSTNASSLVEFLQHSPLAKAIAAGDVPADAFAPNPGASSDIELE